MKEYIKLSFKYSGIELEKAMECDVKSINECIDILKASLRLSICRLALKENNLDDAEEVHDGLKLLRGTDKYDDYVELLKKTLC